MRHRKSMDEVMRALEADRDLALPMDPAYYDQLHDKIMERIEKTPMRPSPWYEKPRRLLLAPWRYWPKQAY